jgi:hypothetical protein
MKKQGISLLKNLTTQQMKTLLLKMVNDLSQRGFKQISEVRRSTQDLHKKVSYMEEILSKEMEIGGGEERTNRNVRKLNKSKFKNSEKCQPISSRRKNTMGGG